MRTTRPDRPLDVDAVRADFPCLADGLAYFDSVASSLTPTPVVDAMVDYYRNYRANIHRGSYDLSIRASERFEAAVTTIARFINAEPDEVVLTQNATQAINLAALTLDFEPGDEIVLSSLEHTSNMAPWMRIAGRRDVTVRWYQAGRAGPFDLDRFTDLLSPRTKLVTLAHVSNVIGSVVPVAEVGRICRERGILFLVDAAQSTPHLLDDVKAIDCDFLAFSGHKMLGPTGVGVLYVRRELGERLVPAVLGGGTIDTTSCASPTLETCVLEHCSFTGLPHKWQAGTPPIAEALGLAAAMDYLGAVGPERLAAHEHHLLDRLLTGMRGIAGVEIHGPPSAEDRHAIVSFNITGMPPEEVGRILDENFGVAVRAGQHCAVNYFFKELNEHVEHPGNVRAGVYLYNDDADVDRLLEGIHAIAGLAA